MQIPPTDTLSRQPTVSASQLRHVPVAVVATVVAVAVVSALVIFLKDRHDCWPAFGWATGFAVISAVASVVIILRSAGKPAEHLVTMSMLLALVRIAISLGGLLFCVFVLNTQMTPTAVLIGGYYAAMVAMESALLRGALNASAPGTNEIQGKQG